MVPVRVATVEELQIQLHVFYKKLGSGHITESFLILHEILAILVQKVSLLVSYFSECRIINVVANTAADMFLDI